MTVVTDCTDRVKAALCCFLTAIAYGSGAWGRAHRAALAPGIEKFYAITKNTIVTNGYRRAHTLPRVITDTAIRCSITVVTWSTNRVKTALCGFMTDVITGTPGAWVTPCYAHSARFIKYLCSITIETIVTPTRADGGTSRATPALFCCAQSRAPIT